MFQEFFGEHNHFYKLLAITILSYYDTFRNRLALSLIFLFLYYVRIKHVYSLVIFCTVFYLTLLFVDFGRGGSALLAIWSFLDNLLIDESIGARALNFLVGVYVVLDLHLVLDSTPTILWLRI